MAVHGRQAPKTTLDFSLNIAAVQAEKARLFREHWRLWLVFADAQFQPANEDLQDVAPFAMKSLGGRPVLIRRADDLHAAMSLMIVDDPA
jgi:hypothetical protein